MFRYLFAAGNYQKRGKKEKEIGSADESKDMRFKFRRKLTHKDKWIIAKNGLKGKNRCSSCGGDSIYEFHYRDADIDDERRKEDLSNYMAVCFECHENKTCPRCRRFGIIHGLCDSCQDAKEREEERKKIEERKKKKELRAARKAAGLSDKVIARMEREDKKPGDGPAPSSSVDAATKT